MTPKYRYPLNDFKENKAMIKNKIRRERWDFFTHEKFP